MSFANHVSRATMVAMGIAAISTLAPAQYQVRSVRSLTQARVSSAGGGQGSIHMPTAAGEGLMVGILVDDKDGKKYTLEAQLTAWIPGLLGPTTRVAFGGVYGQLLEYSGQGMLQDAAPEFAGRVEGTWRMEQDLTGIYEAHVYERNGIGVEVVTGVIEGSFQVQVMDDPVPAPKTPDFVAQQPNKGFSDRLPDKPTLGDARSAAPGTKRTRPVGRKSRPSDLSSARQGYDTPAPRLTDAGSRSPSKKGGVLASIAITQPRDFSDAASGQTGQDPPFSEARRKRSSQVFGDARHGFSTPQRPPYGDARSGQGAAGGELQDARSGRHDDLSDARSSSKPAGKGRKALSDADPGTRAKKGLAHGLSDAANAGSAVVPVPAKGAWGSAAGAVFGTPPVFSTPDNRQRKPVWPVLSGAFRAKYQLMD